MLKDRREEAGFTADQVIEQARHRGATRWSASKLTRLERNEWLRPTVEDVELLLDIYEVTDLAARAEYVQLAKEARQRGWWAAYTDVLGRGPLTGLEPGASRIRTVETLVIPGLLQTEDYARRIIEGGGIDDPAEVTRRVEARKLRQGILDTTGSPPVYWAVIDEAALRKIPEDIREGQIRHLIDVQRPALRVQILPDEAGLHAAVGGGFTMLDFPEDSGLVYTENALTSRIEEEPDEVAAWDLVYQYVSASALSIEASRTMLVNLLQSR
jgi:transcriptional regulator with XRE-family HTH domain